MKVHSFISDPNFLFIWRITNKIGDGAPKFSQPCTYGSTKIDKSSLCSFEPEAWRHQGQYHTCFQHPPGTHHDPADVHANVSSTRNCCYWSFKSCFRNFSHLLAQKLVPIAKMQEKIFYRTRWLCFMSLSLKLAVGRAIATISKFICLMSSIQH